MAQVAIITASDSGIGKECALLLAQQGFDIGITWHSDEEGAKDTAGTNADDMRLLYLTFVER